jgi:hypothetical protein
MQFISESIIDQVIAEWSDRLETEGIEPLLGELGDDQPYVLAYLTSETHDILTEAEREYLLFLGIVLWKSVRKEHPEKEIAVEPDFLEEAEEEAWTLLQESKERAFHRRITPFFEGYPQEDLLAFVEDTLAADEDSPITQTGREPLFVASKAILDALLRAGSA